MISSRLLRAALAAALFTVTLVSASARPALAAGEYLDVTISSVSTATIDLTDPDQVITLKGTVTNVSTVPIRFANVHFWRSPTPLASSAAVTAALEAPPAGERLNQSEDNYFTISQDDEFGPGERVDFTVSGTVAQLTDEGTPLTATDVVYLIGVQVRGLPNDATGRSVVGRDAIAMAATSQSVESSSVVLLTATPTWTTDGTFIDDSLEDELGGRLETLLGSASRTDVVTALDPALYEAAQKMSGTHTVGEDEESGSGVALRWVRRVDELIAAGSVWRLPYGNPDLVRAAASGALSPTLEAAASATPEALLDLPSVAVLSSGADESMLADLSDIDTVIVDGGSGSQAGAPSVIMAASQAELGGLEEGVQLARQVADDLVADRTPLYLITTAAEARRDAELDHLRTRTVPTTMPQSALVWPTDTTVAAWSDVADALHDARGNAGLIGDLSGTEPAGIDSLFATAFSADFATQADALAWTRANAPERVSNDAVTLRAAASFVMGSRTNTFPATLTNTLAVPVTVDVRFTSDSPQRIRVPDLESVTVQPGEALTLEVVPEASSNGVSLVHAQVTSTGGVPIDAPVTIEITATNFGRVGWIIIVVSGAVVLGGTAWRIRTVRRERARAESEGVQP